MPLGWHISVYRQQNEGLAPASFGATHGARLAVWQTGLWGLEWLDELVAQKKAIDLGSNGGYPSEYTAQAAEIIPRIRDNPPEAKAVWSSGAGDILLPGWAGKTTKDLAVMDDCRPDEWLIIQAWDES